MLQQSSQSKSKNHWKSMINVALKPGLLSRVVFLLSDEDDDHLIIYIVSIQYFAIECQQSALIIVK